MNFILRRVVIGALIILPTCANYPFSGTQTEMSGVVLVSSTLYVYSFLDMRDAEFGPKTLAELDKQLLAALEKRGVWSKLLRFKQSEVGRSFRMAQYTEGLLDAGISTPIKLTVSANAPDETLVGAVYRLIVFPSQSTKLGSYRFNKVRWELVDVKSGRIIWTTISQSKVLVGGNNDEKPEFRARGLVDGVLVEMQKSQLL